MIHIAMLMALLGQAQTKSIETHRYAVLVGSNLGNAGEPLLQFTDRDAQGVAQVLGDIGGFERDNIMVLNNPTPAMVQAAFERTQRRVRADALRGNNTLLVVYFSGHADSTYMHLGGALLSYREVLTMTDAVQATSRVLVVDACRSGEATLQKGVRRIAPFLLAQDEENVPSGLAILASASAGESAQESPSLRSSFFTFHLISALRGAADFNADGKVTLTEAFQYSADQTAASTADTLAGVQHATYRYQMRGRADLVLTRPSSQKDAFLVTLADPGEYIFHAGDAQGALVLETHATQPKQGAWLPAGAYYVQRRTPKAIWAGSIVVTANKPLVVAENSLDRIDYVRLASKGRDETAPPAATAPLTTLSVWGGSGAPQLPGFAMPLYLAVQSSHQIGRIILDAQLAFWNGAANQNALSIQLTQFNLLVGARWLFVDSEQLHLSAGLRAGPGFGRQTFTDAANLATNSQVTANGEAVVRGDVSLTSNVFVGLEGAIDISSAHTADTAVRVTPRFSLGVGVAF